ncbi:hypothetical protein DNTS_016055 [Danionella cerebrum]|uniref:Uncharacterized protein n=1 Tax=Danionella cerebrum TaxID=2873325 RepID=A0A553QHQ3_9TELE|nr:hypothetical protein DNTS_016055 [Danionella translucida]
MVRVVTNIARDVKYSRSVVLMSAEFVRVVSGSAIESCWRQLKFYWSGHVIVVGFMIGHRDSISKGPKSFGIITNSWTFSSDSSLESSFIISSPVTSMSGSSVRSSMVLKRLEVPSFQWPRSIRSSSLSLASPMYCEGSSSLLYRMRGRVSAIWGFWRVPLEAVDDGVALLSRVWEDRIDL